MFRSALRLAALCATAFHFAALSIHADDPTPCEPPDCCMSDEDCPDDSYCAKAMGACDHAGSCQSRELPEDWTCAAVYLPVRGCDGNIYDSCQAFRLNINVAYQCAESDTDINDDGVADTCTPEANSPCEPPDCCNEDDDCPEGSYCAKAIGDCDGEGVCQPRHGLFNCPAVWMPVRGCDGQIYGSTCDAKVSDVNIAYECPAGTEGNGDDQCLCWLNACGQCIIPAAFLTVVGMIQFRQLLRRNFKFPSRAADL